MKRYGTIELMGTGSGIKNMRILVDGSLPLDNEPGQMCFYQNLLWVSVVLEGLNVWVPSNSDVDIDKFDQSTPALEWTFTHHLIDPVFQVFDAEGNNITASATITEIDANNVMVEFSQSQTGYLVGVSPVLGRILVQDSASTTWTFDHDLGYNPTINVVVNSGEELVTAIPQKIQYVTNNQAVITFSSAQSGQARAV